MADPGFLYFFKQEFEGLNIDPRYSTEDWDSFCNRANKRLHYPGNELKYFIRERLHKFIDELASIGVELKGDGWKDYDFDNMIFKRMDFRNISDKRKRWPKIYAGIKLLYCINELIYKNTSTQQFILHIVFQN